MAIWHILHRLQDKQTSQRQLTNDPRHLGAVLFRETPVEVGLKGTTTGTPSIWVSPILRQAIWRCLEPAGTYPTRDGISEHLSSLQLLAKVLSARLLHCQKQPNILRLPEIALDYVSPESLRHPSGSFRPPPLKKKLAHCKTFCQEPSILRISRNTLKFLRGLFIRAFLDPFPSLLRK